MPTLQTLRSTITMASQSALFPIAGRSSSKPYRLFKFQTQRLKLRFLCCSFPNRSTKDSTFLQSVSGFHASFESFSTMGGTILAQARDIGKLCMELEAAIEDNRYSDAWKLFEHHMQMEGFPRKSIVNKLLASFAESSDSQWLEKAYGIVEQGLDERKHNLFEQGTLIYLALGLARCGLPVQGSIILRKLVDIDEYPPVSAWSAILAHLSQNAPGALLAAELVLEIGYLFQDGRVDPRKKSNAPLISMKPNTTSFSIALAGCVLFGTTRKGEQLLEMMPRVGVKADTNLLIIMAHIFERNGRREELKKLKRYIDEAHDLTDVQFRQFHNCLLSCHLKFGDLGSAAHMVLEMLRKAKEARSSLAAVALISEAEKHGNKSHSGVISGEVYSHGEGDASEGSRLSQYPFVSFQDFSSDRNFSKLEAQAKELLSTLLLNLQQREELVITDRGILKPTERLYVKLIKAFLEAGKTKELAEFLIKAEKEDSPVSVDDSTLVHVINLCISLEWLDQAHDLLDEMRLAGVKTGSSVYASLLKAYCKANRSGEVSSLLRDARKAGVQFDSSCYEALIQSRVLQDDTRGALNLFKERKEAKIPKDGHREFETMVKRCEDPGEGVLTEKLLQEIKEGERIDHGVHDWNNVINFFSKKRLMQDAEKALKKMRSLGHIPNAQTYHSLVSGYAAVGNKYVEVTELWVDMKSLSCDTGMKFDQELLDSVLYTFVRGGFFFRANEVVEIMEKEDMFVDKYKYRRLFVKYHKTLFKGKAPKVQTETQLKRREAGLKFKKSVGLD